ncbi:MAG TPA: hypothetical protein VFL56_02130 [Solirubrobacterales bacterium]|nr:hypothetical protein [Solirubrobacterales bacterium]
MAEASKPERVEIGFEGGQVLATRLDQKQLGALRTALDKGEGWHDISTEDGDLAVDLDEVIFVRVAAPEHRIGFTTES